MTKMAVTFKFTKVVDAPDHYNPNEQPELLPGLLPTPEDLIAELTPEDITMGEIRVSGENHVLIAY